MALTSGNSPPKSPNAGGLYTLAPGGWGAERELTSVPFHYGWSISGKDNHQEWLQPMGSLALNPISIRSTAIFRRMASIQISRMAKFDESALVYLWEESQSQGFRFVERLVREYRSGANCFNRSGEVLLSVHAQDEIIGIGGLNRDPYLNDAMIGRLRHLYVASAWRRQGIGRRLVDQLIHEARQHYQLLTLRTDTVAADRFYQKLGFQTHPQWEYTTHYLQLGKVAYYPLSVRCGDGIT